MTELGIEDTSSNIGHAYMTVVGDMEELRVVYAVPRKGADTIEAIGKHFNQKALKKTNQTDLY